MKRGSSPAATAWARSTRAQKPWMVEIHARSVSRASARAPRAASPRRMRERSSPAAFSVKVITRSCVEREAVLEDGPDHALGQDRGLPGAGVGRQEHRPLAALDRGELLGGERDGHLDG